MPRGEPDYHRAINNSLNWCYYSQRIDSLPYETTIPFDRPVSAEASIYSGTSSQRALFYFLSPLEQEC